MSFNSFGKLFRITSFGESHGPLIGVVIDGCPSGIKLSEKEIQKELNKRKPGQSRLVSLRKEEDNAKIASGVFQGKTTGHPIALIIENKDIQGQKYEKIKDLFRPGHADYTYSLKYGLRDYFGGGRSSARETAARVAAGAIAKKILSKNKIKIIGSVIQIGNIKAEIFDEKEIQKNLVFCADKRAAKKMEKLIDETRREGDSIGGIIEVKVKNPVAGLGNPVYEKLSSQLGNAILSINAVKGIEFGKGFELASMKGSESNDQLSAKGFKSNNMGGILGGISSGQEIVFRAVVKPASSILKEQETISVKGRKAKIKVEGRHDPCIAIRAVPVLEAMTAIVLADNLIQLKGYEKLNEKFKGKKIK